MNTVTIERTLEGMKAALDASPPHDPTQMPGDVWLLTSAMQKAIRRGEHEPAAMATSSLWNLDRDRFWRRLLVIALEDVGAASPEILTKVLTAVASTRWRNRVGDLQIGLHLVRLLCDTVKTRLADSVFIQAEKAVLYADTREQFAGASNQTLSRCVRDKEIPLMERAIAVWLLAGTKRFPSDYLPRREGDIVKAVAAIRATTTPSELIEACVGVTTRLQWPLALQLPLIWEEMQRYSVSLRLHTIPKMPDVNGLPLYACDGFTRVGKACFRDLKKSLSSLSPFTTAQIALAVFYTESNVVNKRITSPELDAIQWLGEKADIESTCLSIAAYAELREIVLGNMEQLNAIRRDHLKRYLLAGGNNE